MVAVTPHELQDAPLYRARRLGVGLTQRDAAEALGVTIQTISNREAGRGRGLIPREAAMALEALCAGIEARRAARALELAR